MSEDVIAGDLTGAHLDRVVRVTSPTRHPDEPPSVLAGVLIEVLHRRREPEVALSVEWTAEQVVTVGVDYDTRVEVDPS